MNNAQKQEPWAPDGCPDDVVELVAIDNQLAALGLRGLASANSKEIRQGFRQLTAQLKANYDRGRRAGLRWGLAAGAFSGALLVGVLEAALR